MIAVMPRNAITSSAVHRTTRSGHRSHRPPAPGQLAPISGPAASDPSACMPATSGSISLPGVSHWARGLGRGETRSTESR